MQITDFLVHIDETLSLSALEAIEDELRHDYGVMSAGHRSDQPHLVQIVFDSDAARIADIVQNIRQHGLHAQAVGL